MSINRQEFTNAGRDMLGRANAGGILTISRMVIGAGRATQASDLWPLTALNDHRLNVNFSQRIDQGDGVLLCEGSFNSNAAEEAFELCEVGVLAHIGTEADRLYSVANVLATGADRVDPAVESIHAFKIKVVIDRAANVTVVIGTSQDITAENIGAETVGPGWFADKVANTLRFKRVIAGDQIELNDDGHAITIRAKVLKLDLNLYVPMSHPDAPGPDVAFPTIPDALQYAENYTIAANAYINIHVAAGRYQISAPIRINQVNSSQIKIIGASPVIATVIEVSNIRGDPNAFLGDLSLSSGADFAVGDLVLIKEGPFFGFDGVAEVTAVSGNVVTVQTPKFKMPPFDSLAGGGWIAKIPTILDFLNNGLVIDTGIGLLENFIILGIRQSVNTSHGLHLLGGITRTGNYVGIYKCLGNGIYIADYPASFFGRIFSSGNREQGLLAYWYNRVGIANGSAFSGNWQNGIQAHRGFLSAESCVFSGNRTGIYVPSGSVNVTGAIAQDNTTDGIDVDSTGMLYALTPNIARNTRWAVRASFNAFLTLASPTILGELSPAANTVGNGNSYIVVVDTQEEERPEILPP